MITQEFKKRLASLPQTPGVYIFKDDQGRILYIGKAKSLKKRVASYFNRSLSGKTHALVSCIKEIEYRIAPSEGLALLLEASLVHKYKPKYNISLRDDKSFPWVKISREDFPVVCITRKKESDGGRYIGPFTSAKLLKNALRAIRNILPYRSCLTLARKPCMYYRIGLSPAVCLGAISKRAYAHTINSIVMILEGKSDSLVKRLAQKMRVYARGKKFEQAAKLRDQVEALSALGANYLCEKDSRETNDLKNNLNLSVLPLRIEAFDISNISGKDAVGSMVSFYAQKADKSNYRRFRIKSPEQADDCRMLKEVVRRRYMRLARGMLTFPDLIIIDGGKGQLLAALEELGKLKINIPVISIAKTEENIYMQSAALPVKLKESSPALNLIRRIRDEAHRFALSYHHMLRRKRILGK